MNLKARKVELKFQATTIPTVFMCFLGCQRGDLRSNIWRDTMLIEHNKHRPVLGRNVFIAPTATIIGKVTIHDGASIWYGAVLRGDMAPIIIGENTNIQDNCTIHTDYDFPSIIGSHCSVGHNAVIHGCRIDDECLIGMHATILTGAQIKKGSIVAAGSLVKEEQQVGPHQLVAGTPAQFKKTLAAESDPIIRQAVKNYLQLSLEHREKTNIIPS